MAQSEVSQSSSRDKTTQLTLRVWHPDCWTLETTARVDAGLICQGVYLTDDIASGRFTVYADSRESIEELVSAIDASSLTDGVKRLHEYFDPNSRNHAAAGNATEELLVEYRSQNSIYDAFVSRGFVPDEDIRIHGGKEYWTVIITEERTEIRRRLDEIRQENDAEITVEGMKSPSTHTTSRNRSATAQLSERQREVFRLAQQRGYYTWPRETSASELASEMDVSKATLLEHLRKAEEKLLGSLD